MYRKARSMSAASNKHSRTDREYQTMELLGKPNQKMEKSFDFFKTTKISTCSYIKKDGGDFKAIPYYTRPKQQFSELASKSLYTKSITGEAYQQHKHQHVAMRKKPLCAYNPNAQRSRLPPSEHRYHYVNKSEVEIGDRAQSANRNHYVTTNTNHIGRFGQVNPCSHPMIVAERFKWNHHLKNI